MADNVTLPGTGTVVAADDVASVWYQRVKLVDGTLDSTTAIAAGNGTAAGALRVTLPTDGTGVVGLNAGTNNIGDVDVLTVPAPLSTTGNGSAATALRVTMANDSTGIVALTTSTASIGKLAANTGVDIGDVDVTSVVPGTAATNLGKAEDAGHTTGDVGVMALGVRNDADASLAGTDLDYTPISVTAQGNVNVEARRDLVRIAVVAGGLTTSVTSYVAGDQLGTQFTIANAARASGGTGTIVGCVVLNARSTGTAASVIGAVDVVITRASVTLAGDNAAWAINDADAMNIVGIIQCAGAFNLTNNRIAQAFNLAIPYDCSGGTSLYASLITRSGHTFFTNADDITLVLFVERN